MIPPGELAATKHGILEAVFAELAATPLGQPGRACVVPGSELAWDDCEGCGGTLAVHMTGMWPTDSFPGQGQRSYTGCSPKMWAAEFVVTVLRCVPDTESEDPPACEDLAAKSDELDADMEAMQRAVLCLFRPHDDGYQPPVALGLHLAVGPEGMCAGSQLSIVVGFLNCRVECDG